MANIGYENNIFLVETLNKTYWKLLTKFDPLSVNVYMTLSLILKYKYTDSISLANTHLFF